MTFEDTYLILIFDNIFIFNLRPFSIVTLYYHIFLVKTYGS
jgi:hypothetical protein